MQFQKTKDEVLDYGLDYLSLLEEGETLQTSEFAIYGEDPMVLAIDSAEFTDNASKVWLSAGTEGVEYLVENTVTTSEGRTYERAFTLQIVRSRSS